MRFLWALLVNGSCLCLALCLPAVAQGPLPSTGFEQSQGARWTTHEEEMDFLTAVDALSSRMQLLEIGRTQQGRPLHLVRLGHPQPPSLAEAQQRPVELHLCSQHGNEPAGREACLIQIRELALTTDPRRMSQMQQQLVLFVPSANPDGRAANTRENAAGVDLNRQHLQLDQPEVQAIGRAIRDYRPVINMDHHEYGPTLPVLYDDDVLILWPRNLNVYPPLRDAAFEFAIEAITPCTEAAGYSVDEYGLQSAGDLDLQQTAGDWDDGISRNVGGLRHSFGILVESAVSANPRNPEEMLDALLSGDMTGGAPASMRRRVQSQVQLIDCALNWMLDHGADGLTLTRESAQAKAKEGQEGSAPTYFDGQDEDTTLAGALSGSNAPQTWQDPPFCGFLVAPEQVDAGLRAALDIHGIGATERADGGLFISMAQEAEPVIGLLLDARSGRHLLAAEGLMDCSDAGVGASPRSEDLSALRGGALSWTWAVLLSLLGLARCAGRCRRVAFSAVLLLSSMLPSMAWAGLVCAPPVPKALCGGRIFAEPLGSVGGLTYREMVLGMQALAIEYPDWVQFREIGQGSADGLALYVVEVTAPELGLPLAERGMVLVNQSVHGNEPGGREGAVRYIEDLVTGQDPERAALLQGVRLIQTFINPDGWSAGDHDHLQTGGGAYLWVRQNGAGPISGASDLGLGVDLNRQAPWRGISHSSGPVSQPESIAFVDFVRQLAAEGDIRVAADIHGEVTDAAAWVMLSSGQFDLGQALNQRYHGEAIHAAIAASLEDSLVSDLINTVTGGVEPTVLTASSEFGSIASESTASGTGFLGDWISQMEGGGAASLSTIELYNFIGSPGVNSLSARPEVMQYYRDVVRGILGGMIDQAVFQHETRLQMAPTLWLDDLPRVEDPVRSGVLLSAADFFRDLQPLVDGDLRPTQASRLLQDLGPAVTNLIISSAGLQSQPEALSAVREYVRAGGNLVLTDAALALLPLLLPSIPAEAISTQFDAGGKVSYQRQHPLATGIRDIAWMNTETATIGLRVEGSGANVPAWRVEQAAWEAAGGSTAGLSGSGQTSVGELPLGQGQIRIIGVLLPTPDNTDPGIGYGINAYGVLDTGYIVLANALGGNLVHRSLPLLPAVAADPSAEPRVELLNTPMRGGGLSLWVLLLLWLGPRRCHRLGHSA